MANEAIDLLRDINHKLAPYTNVNLIEEILNVLTQIRDDITSGLECTDERVQAIEGLVSRAHEHISAISVDASQIQADVASIEIRFTSRIDSIEATLSRIQEDVASIRMREV